MNLFYCFNRLLIVGFLAVAFYANPALAQTATDASQPIRTEQPRGFGYVIGDVLTQRVLLDNTTAQSLQDLPGADRAGLWFERRAARIQLDVLGQRWLVLEYQIINSPLESTTVKLPRLALSTTNGQKITLDSWPVSISPLTPEPVTGQGDHQAIRPDRLATPTPTQVLQTNLTRWLLALAVIGFAWLAWLGWRNRHDRVKLPFEHAWHELKQLKDLNSNPAAWQSVHHALNAAAGHAVQTGSVERLLTAAPQFGPLKADLESFFDHSDQRFFARSATPKTFDLLGLCRSLRRIERQATR